MADANDALMEGGQATFEKAGEKVVFELEPKTVGLTKEQLEKYRNDPFWKPVRTILFAIFWLAWVAMFAAAIAIVVLSPKCAAKEKAEWWQTKSSYQLLTATFHDTDGDGVGDFNGITEKMDLLRKLGVTTVYPTPVIEVKKDEFFNSYDVMDHLAVEKRFGTEEDFKKLIEAAHDRDMYVVMDLPLTSISVEHKWFTSGDVSSFITSKTATANFHNYTFVKNTTYLGYPSKENPVLNWQEPKVRNLIMDAVKKFLSLGVDGFHLDHISQLAMNPDGTTDRTKAIATLKNITTSIKEFVASQDDLKDKKIVLFSSLRDIEDLHPQAKETGDLHYVIDNSFTTLSSAEHCKSGLAACIHQRLTKAHARNQVDGYVPYWQFSNPDTSRLSSRFDEPTANLLTFMQLTLPGAMSLYYGQEIGLVDSENVGNFSQRGIMQWKPKGDDHHGFLAQPAGIDKLFFGESANAADNNNFESQYANENSPLKVYQKLAKLRQREEAMIVGETVHDVIKGDTILYGRYVHHNGTANGPAFIVALNFGDSASSIKLTELKEKVIPAEKDLAKAEIVAVTTGVSEYRARQKLDLSAVALDIPAKQGVLVKL